MKINNVSHEAFKSFYTQRKELQTGIDKKNKKETVHKMTVAASLAGAFIPLMIYNAKKGGAEKIKDTFTKQSSTLKEKASSVLNLIQVSKPKQIIMSVTGSILGGLAAGVSMDRDKKNRNSKYKEAIYGFANCLVPIGLITGAEKIAQKTGRELKAPAKAGIVAAGIAGGMFAANKISNVVNKHIFKEENFKERKTKPSDFLIHADDILGVMAISGVPFAKQLGMTLPLIYSHVGYESGTKTASINQ